MLPGNCKPALHILIVLLIFGFFSVVDAQDEGCYTSGSVAGIVIATIVVTVVMGGLAAAFIWYLWKQRKGEFEDAKSLEKPIMCPPMSPDKQQLAKENSDYAFDNPYFKDDEPDRTTTNDAEKGETGFHLDNGDIPPASQQNVKASNGTNGQAKKNRPFSSLPFHSVFHPSSGKKQKTATDDTYISKHLERMTVPLRGHDFTGLGFNICGNMRDGIFVKDVLHRGPASESGKIKAGDRIVGVNVSFSGMVYEDALTILSYASPYDVKLEIEKNPTTTSSGNVPPSSSPKRLGASTSFRSAGQRGLFHPLYRSQSIDDLTQIGKDIFLSGNSPSSQKDSSATPKRSQSVETNSAASKTRAAYTIKSNDESASKSVSSSKGSRKSSTSSCDSTGKIIITTKASENAQPAPVKKETPCTKKEVKSSRFRVEQINVKTEAPPTNKPPPVKPARDSAEEKQIIETVNQINETDDPIVDATSPSDATSAKPTETPLKSTSDEKTTTTTQSSEATNKEEADANKPTAPPRKISTPKRKAPAPPPTSITKTETSAVVHRADEKPLEQTDAESEPLQNAASEPLPVKEEPPPLPTTELPDFVPVEKSRELDLESSDTSSIVSGSNASQKEEPASPGKRKASSLGDLTKLEHGTHKKASTSSAILERAVSLDLQQSLPGENLIKQKKILKAPTFEKDYDEDRESDSLSTDATTLKRWDNGLDKVLGLTNGHVKHEDESSDSEEVKPSASKTAEGLTLSTVIESEAVTKKLITVDIDLDSSNSETETALQETLDSEKHLTSTPVRKVIEIKNHVKDSDSLDDESSAKPRGNLNEEDSTTKHSNSNTSVFSPITISIPIIKPDLTHFEKLPSPPPASTHPALDPNWRVSKVTTSDDTNRYSLEKISVHSLYRPIFSGKDVSVADETAAEATQEKLVNGNDSDASEHYSTAQETSVESNNVSSFSVTMSPIPSSSSNSANVTIKTPNSVAGFAKTLIIPGPNEVENLLSLAAEPNTPPPQLEPPPKSIENE